MATQNFAGSEPVTFPSAADYATVSKIYHIIMVASGLATLCSSAADVPLGILQDEPAAANAPASIKLLGHGIAKVVSNGTINGGIAEGDYVGVYSDGRAVKKSTTNDIVIGRALDASSADGVVIRVDLAVGGNQIP